MARRKSFNDFRGFKGPDCDIETSLREYGLAWKLVSKREDEYLIIYGIGFDESCNYNRFSYGHLTRREWNNIVNEPWFNLREVSKYCGTSKKAFTDSFPYTLADAIAYHGSENILGGCYDEGFPIGKD